MDLTNFILSEIISHQSFTVGHSAISTNVTLTPDLRNISTKLMILTELM